MVVDLYNILANVAFPVICAAFLGFIVYKQSETLKEVALQMTNITNTLNSINNRLDTVERQIDRIDLKINN